MVVGDEVEALTRALDALDRPAGEVLADHPGRRRVVRAGDAVVKAFSSVERDAWAREVAGLRAAAADPGLTVEPVGSGERWSATRWIGGRPPMRVDGGSEEDAHRALGSWLARLHAVAPDGMPAWPVVDRLRALLASPPEACPPSLVQAVGRLIDPLVDLVVGGSFVHGDWGTANVLVAEDDPCRILAVIDLEDAHAGDPAEDFAWQVLAGAESGQLRWMSATYAAAGGSLGPHAVERLVVCGAHLCLEVAGWGIPGHTERCLATLDALGSGDWPPWPA